MSHLGVQAAMLGGGRCWKNEYLPILAFIVGDKQLDFSAGQSSVY